jgi:PhzF family phenazine biosynthesis protein
MLLMKVTAYLVKSFTKDPSFGNPTGIIFDADPLSDKQMLFIARKLNFAESAFVQNSKGATYKNRFFAPEQEVPLCGHATLATLHSLIEKGRVSFDQEGTVTVSQEALAGVLSVTAYKDGLIVMNQNKPIFFEPEKDRALVARLLGITTDDILDQPIQAISTGAAKLIVPVVSFGALMKIKPDLSGIKEYSIRTGTRGFYPYTTEVKEKSSDFHARQFDPLVDSNEDPVTGVAAGALGSYIKEHGFATKRTFVIEQGYHMGKAGKMYVDVSDGVKVGGYCVTYGKEIIEVPEVS